jgi:hypothetical protein
MSLTFIVISLAINYEYRNHKAMNESTAITSASSPRRGAGGGAGKKAGETRQFGPRRARPERQADVRLFAWMLEALGALIVVFWLVVFLCASGGV